VDQFRYYVLGSIPVNDDGEYSIPNVEERINNELMKNFSNFCFRTLSILSKAPHNGQIKDFDKSDPIIADVDKKIAVVMDFYEKRNFKEVVTKIMEISSIGNKLLQDKKPWANPEEAPAALALASNIIRNLSILLTPIMPGICANLQRQLNVGNDLKFSDLGWNLVNHQIGKPEILVMSLAEKAPVEPPKPKAKAPAKKEDLPMDISRINIRVGKIVHVKKHESADSLYVEQIDIGEDKPRNVVSGLVKFVPIEEMQDRMVLVVCNLKPANLKGVRSEAMVLAASNDDHTQVQLLIPPQGSKVGERVTVEGFSGDADEQLNPKHKVWETVQPELKTNDKLEATWRGVGLKTSGGVCTVTSIANGNIK